MSPKRSAYSHKHFSLGFRVCGIEGLVLENLDSTKPALHFLSDNHRSYCKR